MITMLRDEATVSNGARYFARPAVNNGAFVSLAETALRPLSVNLQAERTGVGRGQIDEGGRDAVFRRCQERIKKRLLEALQPISFLTQIVRCGRRVRGCIATRLGCVGISSRTQGGIGSYALFCLSFGHRSRHFDKGMKVAKDGAGVKKRR
jgi:hypothetical protein